MTSFLRGRLSKLTGGGSEPRQASRDVIIRDALLAELGEVCGEMGYLADESSLAGGVQQQQSDELSEAGAQLCQCVEAMLLHGLKDSFLWQTVSVMGGGASGDRRPEPNFWPPLLVFTHRDTIQQIQQLSQLQSEIGHCRAWIRTALNDGLLAAYVATMRADGRALEPYYRRVAFVRDGDRMAVAQQLLAGLEQRMAGTAFVLSVNSSLLNRWPDRPLQLAGLYAPAVRSQPVSAGFDVVSSLVDEVDEQQQPDIVEEAGEAFTFVPTAAISMPRRLPIDQPYQQSITNSFGTATGSLLAAPSIEPTAEATPERDHDLAELFRRMESVEQRKQREGEVDQQLEQTSEDDVQTVDPDDGDDSLMGNSIRSSGWSTEDRPDDNDDCESIPSTFSTLVARHRDTVGRQSELNPAEVWQRFVSSLMGGEEGVGGDADDNVSGDVTPKAIDQPYVDDEEVDITTDLLGFEVVPMDAVSSTRTSTHFSLAELRRLVGQSSQIARERGIDAQDYRCAGCPAPLGVGKSTAALLCHFSGAYYCAACIAPQPHHLPARIICNWDFERRPVSRTAALFLHEFQLQPFVDLKLLNPAIYGAVAEMARLQSLRIQLNFVRAYLSTCSTQMAPAAATTPATSADAAAIDAPPTDDTFVRLQKLLWPRNYLYDTIHRYSLADLLALAQLAADLRLAVEMGVRHVRQCTDRCTARGFICELCQRSDSVLFPFDVETTVRCDRCSAVFHAECFEADDGAAGSRDDERPGRPCPRCERRKMRAKRSVSDTGSSATTGGVAS